MLKKKYHTTPLYPVSETPPVSIMEPKRPSRFRALYVVWNFVKSYWRARLGSGRNNQRAKGIIWRQFFEGMGGLWTNIGQMMALRTDLYDKAFVDELSNLQHKTVGFPFSYVKESIEASIGNRLEQIFVKLEETPLAVASMAQIHRATLRYNGHDVAVKVLRPFAREWLDKDMAIFKKAFKWLSRFKRYQTVLLADMIWELENQLKDEADFRYESKNLKASKKEFGRYNIYIPKVYKQYSSKEVIVTEYLSGVTMTEYIKAKKEDPERLDHWVEENKIKAKKLGRRLLKSVWHQALESNYFHGNLQPDNIILLRKNRLAFIDLGSVGTTDQNTLIYINRSLIAIGNKDFRKAANLNMMLAPYILSDCRNEIQKNIMRAIRSGLVKSSLTDIAIEKRYTFHNISEAVQGELTRFGIPPNWSLLKINRVFLTLDASVLHLYPRIDLEKEWLTYRAELATTGIKAKVKRVSELVDTVGNTTKTFAKIINRNALELRDKAQKGVQIALYFLSLLKWGLFAVLFLALWSYLYHHHDIVDYLHHEYDNWFFTLSENLPPFPKIYWFVIKAIVILLLWRYYRFVTGISQAKNRY